MQRVVANPQRPELCPETRQLAGVKDDVKCREGIVFTMDNRRIGRCVNWNSACKFR